MKYLINSCGYNRCPANWNWDTGKRIWYDYDLWVVLDGLGTLTFDNRVYDVSRGDCFCLEGGKQYIGQHNPHQPLRVINIHFDFLGDEGNILRPYVKAPASHRFIQDISLLERILDKFIDSYRGTTQKELNWFELAMEELMLHDQKNPLVSPKTSEAVIDQVKSLIFQNPSTHYRVQAIAKMYGYSSDHLSRLFRKNTGNTLEAYMIRTRINEAIQLLTESNMTVTEIALALGYKDLQHFSKQFKNVTEETPTRFRSLLQANTKA